MSAEVTTEQAVEQAFDLVASGFPLGAAGVFCDYLRRANYALSNGDGEEAAGKWFSCSAAIYSTFETHAEHEDDDAPDMHWDASLQEMRRGLRQLLTSQFDRRGFWQQKIEAEIGEHVLNTSVVA